MGMMCIFALCAGAAVAVSAAVDSAESPKSERLLIQEGTGNLAKITNSPPDHGGLKALAHLAHHVVGFAETADTSASVKTASLHATTAKVWHPLPHLAAEKMAAAQDRLSALASLSKLQDEGAAGADAGNGEGAADASAAPEASNRTAAGDADDAFLTPDTRYDLAGHPGWAGKNWDTSDWVVWTLTGPVFTMTACMFIFYTYGWMWALATLLVLVGVDMFAFYYNV
jgi:hypothetical protein